MEDNPLVSIIMPAYNCENYIQQAINSILNQSYENFELLISDDGSIDNTREVINSFKDSRIKCFHNNTNIGNLKTRNKLFKLSTGSLIAVQDADDLSSSTRIEKQVEIFQSDLNIKACLSFYHRIDLSGNVIVRNNNAPTNVILDVNNFRNYIFCMASIMLKREVYIQVGGLHPYFDRLFAEDLYWIYLIIEKFKIVYLRESLYFYRFNPSSLTNNIDDIRKLSITDVVSELIKQRRMTGTDWLEQKQFEKAKQFENSLLNSKSWLAEKYRVYSAVKIDANKYKEGKYYLLKSLKLNPFNLKSYRTLIYLFKNLLHF